ncbi:MAG: dTDP-4-dehydrorhamnose reductase [Limisphaerales bacterium]|jgi:dTDP-4-dehydrorhamnose reductase
MINLVTGGGGFLGGHFLRIIPTGHETVAFIRNSRAPHGTAVVEGDLADPQKVEEALLIVEPTAIFHLGANADAAACEKDPHTSRRVNVESTIILAKYAARLEIPFVFCSTDLVFSGSNAPYIADANTDPLMEYGRQKAEAEAAVRDIYKKAIIARLPLMYGAAGDGLLNHAKRGMVSSIVQNLRAGKEVKLFEDEYRTMANARRVAEGLWHFGLNNISGTWNFGAPDRMSRHGFGIAVAELFGLDKDLVLPVSQTSVQTGTPRPADVSLDSSAAFEAGYKHGTIREELREIKARSTPYKNR